MREQFKWYFPPNEDEISAIWESGILTVDTNVLLDLYRYHEDTRQAILQSLETFKGRIWISYQVADEFFRNRNSVIVSSGGAFNEVEKCLSEIAKNLEEPIKQLRANRIIPDGLVKELDDALQSALSKSKSQVEEARSNYPNYRENDPILERVCTLLDGEVGSPFSEQELTDALKEAKRRKDNKIPPGFKDSTKDGYKPYGDYFLWRQIMTHIQNIKRPLVFVTSEQKDDWWEKPSGKTIGPHYELLKEFHQETQQRFLFYRTDRFLEFALKRTGGEASSEAVEEIRAIAKERQIISPLIQLITQNEEICAPEWNLGTLKIKLTRPAYNFTCSGHFNPELEEVPKLTVKLSSAPTNMPEHTLRCGTGTTFDFNIHIKSTEYGKHLPEGEYTFTYDAVTSSIE